MTRSFSPSGKALRRRRAFRPLADALEGRTLLTAGALDPTFGTGGSVLTSFKPETSQSGYGDLPRAAHVLADGSILVVGNTATSADFGLVKLTGEGKLDTTFGTGGRVATDFFGSSDWAQDLVVQSDGKIVVAGFFERAPVSGGSPYDYDIGVARYNADGSPDTSFGSGGKVYTNISTYQASDTFYQRDEAYAVALQGDKIIVSGMSYSGTATQLDTTLVRYNANGSLDSSFGDGGKVVTPVSAGPDWNNESVNNMVVLPGSSILVVGDAEQGNGVKAIFLARYLPDGILDTSFGTGGITIVPNDTMASAYGRDVAILADGSNKILVAGSMLGDGDYDVALVRLQASGAIDTTFGTHGDGIVRIDSGSRADDYGRAMAIQHDGKIVVAGWVGSTNQADTMVARLLQDGRRDPDFGVGGFAINAFSANDNDQFIAAAIQADGRIVAVGQMRYAVGKNGANTDILVARYLGDPAPGFLVTPTSGLVTTEAGGTASFSVALAAQPTSDVTIPISSSNTNEGTVSTSVLTFTPDNWNVPQTVTIMGVDDALGDGDVAYTIVLGPAASDDPDYSGLDPADVAVTNLDNETKFYVVNDGSPDRTYEYTVTGNTVENYSLNAANTAPRGAASTAVGDKVWVVDANKNVYVYNTSGGLLGFWTAGSLASNATVEGIATDGTDIWIVDARQDKVFRYTGAASRLSGSQNAAGSFNLNSGNTGPKDIVTDGTSLWVVNDASTDKVFKYDLSGSLLGSWTITGAGSSPTGITLDPSNVAHLWIVDSGTKLVYQFDNAAGRTSGSQSPSTSFALAAGNTNPQGIADPAAASATSRPASPVRLIRSRREGPAPLTPARAPASTAAGQEPAILVPLSPPSDEDLTLLAAEVIRTGTKRTRAWTRA
jgi:uncharacterized delta-60 repeat protein